jgi:uncharacterized protein
MEPHRRSLVWRPTSAPEHGIERTHITIGSGGFTAVGHVLAFHPEPFEIYYRVEADTAWRTRYASVAEVHTGRSVELSTAGDGTWSGSDARILSRLDGALDVDISATPLSNTLPVRRLGLAVGARADIVTAYIEVPGLRVDADPQRYTRLLPTVYRYESLDSDFRRDVVLDDEGFVLDYPGLFVRGTEDDEGAPE